MKKLIAAIGLLVLLAGTACSKKAPASLPTSSPSTSPTPTATSTWPPYHPTIDPSKFTTNITNTYFPLKPGTVHIMEGTRDGAPIRIEMTVTRETKTIMGVKCLVIRDIVSGALDERTTDWYAQDDQGNVWYFGEDTKEYTNGKVSSTAGSWTGGVDGALPGIIMYAQPTPGGAYRQEYRPGVAEDVAKVIKVNDTVQAGGKTYTNVVVTEDTDLLDSSKLEHKYFAPGAGAVKLDGMVNGHHEVITIKSVLTTK